MPTPSYSTAYRTTTVARDVVVLSCTPAPISGVAGAAVNLIGVFESAEIMLKRGYADTTGAADVAHTSRAIRWEKGSVKLTGFTRGTTSALAALFASGSHAILQLQESATGDAYQLMCTCEDFSKSLSKSETNKDSLTLSQEGVPFFGAAGAAVAAMVLEG